MYHDSNSGKKFGMMWGVSCHGFFLSGIVRRDPTVVFFPGRGDADVFLNKYEEKSLQHDSRPSSQLRQRASTLEPANYDYSEYFHFSAQWHLLVLLGSNAVSLL